MSEQPTQPQEQKPEEPTLGLPNVLDQLKGAGPKPTPPEIALLLAQIQAWDSERYRRWKDEQDEKWRRWKEEQEEKKREKEMMEKGKSHSNNFSELFGKLMERIDALEKRLAEGEVKKKEPEMPDWAKAIQEEVQAIRQRFKEEEQKERDRKLIEEHQRPLLEKLKEAEARYAQLEKTLEEMKKMPLTPQETTSLNTTLKQIKETLTDIRETAKLMGMAESTSQSQSPYYPIQGAKTGIPISGSIPAWWIFIPSVVDEVLASIEKRVDKLVGLAKPPQTTEELIKIPEFSPTPPTPEVREIPITPVPPKVEVTLPPPTEPTPPEIIKLPETEVTVTPTPPATSEPTSTKKYTCVCGETFNTSLEKARHVKKCPKAKEEREKKKEKEKVEPSGN
jgi:hypothetical protein